MSSSDLHQLFILLGVAIALFSIERHFIVRLFEAPEGRPLLFAPGALEALHTAGVFVRLEEFKGRAPIRRGSLCIEATPHDFDNPLADADLELRTGGSRSAGMRMAMTLMR